MWLFFRKTLMAGSKKYEVSSILLALPFPEGSWVESLSLILPVFHESILLTLGLFSKKEKISTPPPCRLSTGIYLFYENWSTETFRKSQKKVSCYTQSVGVMRFWELRIMS
jgi:hypothetical protein